MYRSCIFMRFSTIFTALFYPYIAKNLILSVPLSLFALFLIERHCSQNHGSLKSEEQLSDFIEQCAQLCHIHWARCPDSAYPYLWPSNLVHVFRQSCLQKYMKSYSYRYSAYLFINYIQQMYSGNNIQQMYSGNSANAFR